MSFLNFWPVLYYPTHNEQNTPQYNIRKSDDSIFIDVAVGPVYGKDELTVDYTKEHHVVIAGRERRRDGDYLYTGVPHRQFMIEFQMPLGATIKGATLEDGFLMVELRQDGVPEGKSIPISTKELLTE